MFGALPATGSRVDVPDASMHDGGRRIVVQLNVPQAVVRMGGAGIMRKDPDFIPAYLVNHILGGGSFTSRLYDEVREKRGLAYGVYSYLLTMRHAAMFMAQTQTQAPSTREALELIEAQIKRMVAEGPTEDELAKAKAYLKGSYALNFDTSTKIASILLQNQLDDLGIDYIDKRNAMIDAVTLEDARRAAKRLAPGRHAGHRGRPAQGPCRPRNRAASSVLLFPPSSGKGDKASDASSNRSNRRGRTTSPPCWHAPATRSRPCGRAMPTVRCRCCACPSGATTSPPSSATRALLRDNTSDVVFLGTGGSSLGGQTLAQLAGHAVPGVGALRDPPRIHFMDNLDPDSYGALLERLPLKTSRFVAVSKSGGTGETLMQTIAALDAVKAAKLDPRRAFPRHHRAGQARQVATGCAICSPPTRSA